MLSVKTLAHQKQGMQTVKLLQIQFKSASSDLKTGFKPVFQLAHKFEVAESQESSVLWFPRGGFREVGHVISNKTFMNGALG